MWHVLGQRKSTFVWASFRLAMSLSVSRSWVSPNFFYFKLPKIGTKHASAFLMSFISAHVSTCCLPEKCYETLHLRYYDVGATWGRIHLRNVEQCTCVAGEAECQRVRYTSKSDFVAPCVNLVLVVFCLFSWAFVNAIRATPSTDMKDYRDLAGIVRADPLQTPEHTQSYKSAWNWKQEK